MSRARTIRGQVAIVGIGETAYYKHGQAPESEFALALQAILRACEDAGIDPRQIDGFASYSNDRNDPSRLAAALGLPSCASPTCSGAAAAAAARRRSAMRRRRSRRATPTAWWSSARWRRASSSASARRRRAARSSGEAALTFPYGLISPAQRFAHAGDALHARARRRGRRRSAPSRSRPTTTRRPTRAR